MGLAQGLRALVMAVMCVACSLTLSLPRVRIVEGTMRYATQPSASLPVAAPSTPVRGSKPTPRKEPGKEERNIFELIRAKDYPGLRAALSALPSTRLESGRNVVYTLCETSRRMKDISQVLPMLAFITPETTLDCSEDDVMPLLDEWADQSDGAEGGIFELVSYLQSRGVAFSAKGYSVLIKGFGRNKNIAMVDRVAAACVEAQRQGGLSGDVILLNSLMDAYIRCGQAPRALHLFAGVREAGPVADNGADPFLAAMQLSPATPLPPAPPDTRTTAALFTSSFSSSSFSSSLPIVQPNIVTFNTALKALRDAPAFLPDTYRACLSMLAARGLRPDFITVATLVDLAASRGYFALAEGLISEGNEASVEAYTSLLSRFIDDGQTGRAMGVMAAMEARGVLPSDVTCTAFMRGCLMEGGVALGRRLLQRGRELYGVGQGKEIGRAGQQPGQQGQGSSRVKVAFSAISSFNQGKRMGKPMLAALYDEFVCGICTAAAQADSSFLSAVSSAFDPAYPGESAHGPALLQEAQIRMLEMEALGMRPSLLAVNAFIQGLCKRQPSGPRLGDALEVVAALRRDGRKPDRFTNSILFTALGTNQRGRLIEESLELFLQAVSEAGSLDTAAVNALLRTLDDSAEPLRAVVFYFYLRDVLGPREGRGGVPSGRGGSGSGSGSGGSAEAVAPAFPFEPDVITYNILFHAITKAFAEPSGLATMLARGVRVRARLENEAAAAAAAGVGLVVGDAGAAVSSNAHASAAAAATASASASSSTAAPLSHLARALAAMDLSTDPLAPPLAPGPSSPPAEQSVLEDQADHEDLEFYYTAPLPRTLDRLVDGVFRDMRLAHNIAPDEKLVSTLVQLFTAAAQGERGGDRDAGYSWEGYGSSLFRSPPLSEATAQLVFEELIVAGVEVSAMLPILQQCRLSARDLDGIMRDDGAVQRIRASAASSRLFKKYKWNEIKSGWSGLF